MIRPLRARHRGMITVSAIVLPVLFVLGLLARRPVPTMDLDSRPELPAAFAVVSESDEAWAGLPLRTTWLRDDGTSRLAVTLRPLEALGSPDLLVYWTDRDEATTEFPADATLLGALGGAPAGWVLPPGAGEGRGRLLLYSLARHELLGAASYAGSPPP